MNFHFDIVVDFHGRRVDAVLLELEELFFSNADKSIMLIHGRGDGKLRKAIRDFIKDYPNIKNYSFGEDLNLPGADGVTIVYT